MKKILRTYRLLTVGVALAAIVVVAYVRVWNAGFVWDDDAYVTANTTLRDASGLIDIWTKPGATPQYYPMVHSTFWLEYQIWGDNPRGYHVVNVLLHIAVSLLLGRLVQNLNPAVAWPAAFLYALHPMQVESVAWITERKNVLSGVFFLMSAIWYLNWRFDEPSSQSRKADPEAGPVSGRYWLAFLFFVLALLSKTTTCVLPAAVLVVIWWRTGKVAIRDCLLLSPYFVVGLSFGLMTAWMEKWRVGAVGEEFSLTVLQKLLVSSHALCFYAWKAVVPQNLTFIYPRWDFSTVGLTELCAPFTVVVAGIILIVLAMKGNRGPLTIAALYAGLLFPALGFFNVYPMRYSFVADHFSYLAMMPLLTGLTWLALVPGVRLLTLIFNEREEIQSSRIDVGERQDVLACFLICVVCLPLTFSQTGMYRDLETLWRMTIERNPSAWMAHHNLGILLEQKGETTEALTHYLKAVSLNPRHVSAMNNAGLLQIADGRFQEAEMILRKAVEVSPKFDKAHNNLANALVRQGRLQEAVSEYDKALHISPNYETASRNRAAVLNAMNNSSR